jgi:hypothetical protein
LKPYIPLFTQLCRKLLQKFYVDFTTELIILASSMPLTVRVAVHSSIFTVNTVVDWSE